MHFSYVFDSRFGLSKLLFHANILYPIYDLLKLFVLSNIPTWVLNSRNWKQENNWLVILTLSSMSSLMGLFSLA
jgi:hypothetical protein